MKIIHEQVQTNAALPMRFQIYSTEGELIPMHWHNSMEIVYILSGAMDVTVKDHITRLFPGDFTIINSREIHGTHCTGPTKVFLLQLPYRFLKEHIPEYDFVRFRNFSSQFSFPGENSLKPIFDQMAALFSSTSTESRLRLTALLYSLLAELTAGYMVRLTENAKSKSDKNFQRLSFLMEYVESHYEEPLGIADAASLLHLEEAYFCRFFKKYMGQTFLEYVSSVRLRHITDDMIHTDLPLMEILERHGFHNYKVFSRLFKEAYGMTPRQKRGEWNQQLQSS
ncbi:MAG: AraC family transcriptional regulator [Lachnospiraceae bacterium]|nr:AraC family transcriptional regulator [Lachnospiraceae bacterium]